MYQFKALCFGHSSTHQVTLVSEWVHRREICHFNCLDDWLVIVELVPLLLQHCEQLFQNLRIVFSWEKSDLELPSRAQYRGMLINTIWQTLRLSGSGILWTTSFFSCHLLKKEMWQQLLNHMTSLEWVVLRGHTKIYLLSGS